MSLERTCPVLAALMIGLLTGCGTGASSSGKEGTAVPVDTPAVLRDSTSAMSAPTPGDPGSAALSAVVIDAPNGTFGYDILSDGKLLIHQTSIPGLPGNEGCRTKADAEKLAALVMDKIRKGEMPPTVTTAELVSLELIPSPTP